MELSKELLAKAKECKTAEEIISLAKEHGVELSDKEASEAFAYLNRKGELSDKEASEAFAYLNRKGELSDKELSAAASGGIESSCHESGETPLYNVGERVRFYERLSGPYETPFNGVISSISDKREGYHPEWIYTIAREDGIATEVYEHQIYCRI